MKKLSLTQKILEKNYVIFIISILISIGIWMYMSVNSTNDTTVTVSNIPIQMELSDSAKELGLQVFTGDQTMASVTVTGNRATLGQVTESDLTVTASANSVSTTGNYTLPVSAAGATARSTTGSSRSARSCRTPTSTRCSSSTSSTRSW